MQRFTYRQIELLDMEDAPLPAVLPLALTFLRDALADGGTVLVHWSVPTTQRVCLSADEESACVLCVCVCVCVV
jgi:hypothetical protein